MNKLAIQKVKNKSLAEKAAKEEAAFAKARQEKQHEKQQKYKQKKEIDRRDYERTAIESFKNNTTEVKQRLNNKLNKDKLASQKVYEKNFDNFMSQIGGDENDGKSQMSKTQVSGAWGRGANQSKSVMFAGGGQYYDFHAVGQEL